MTRICLLAVGVGIGTSATACGTKAPGVDARQDASSSVRPSSHAAAPTVVPSAVDTCEGIAGCQDAARLVHDGAAEAVVDATVTASPSGVTDNARVVPIASFTLLAGQLADGTPQSVVEASAGGDNVLPVGRYLLLLGDDGAGHYFLSDGVDGSFATDGTSAFERCSVAGNPGSGAPVTTGQTSVDTLVGWFRTAIATDPDGPSASGPSYQTHLSPRTTRALGRLGIDVTVSTESATQVRVSAAAALAAASAHLSRVRTPSQQTVVALRGVTTHNFGREASPGVEQKSDVVPAVDGPTWVVVFQQVPEGRLPVSPHDTGPPRSGAHVGTMVELVSVVTGTVMYGVSF